MNLINTPPCKLSFSLCMTSFFLCRIWFRSIPVNRLQQIIEVLESDIVVRLVSFFSKFSWFNLKGIIVLNSVTTGVQNAGQ